MKKMLGLSCLLLILSSSAYAMGGKSSECRDVKESEIKALFDRWNQSLQTSNPKEVVKNYARDAVLLPTVSNTPRTTPSLIEDYFVMFLKKSPVGVINQSTVRLGCNSASDVGIYTFTLNGKDQVRARYSFNYEFIDGQWLITHHHSSAMPE